MLLTATTVDASLETAAYRQLFVPPVEGTTSENELPPSVLTQRLSVPAAATISPQYSSQETERQYMVLPTDVSWVHELPESVLMKQLP